MSENIKFEDEKSDVPKGIKVVARSPDRNELTITTKSMAQLKLFRGILLISIFAIPGFFAANMGPGGIIVGAIVVVVLFFALRGMFTNSTMSLTVTPQAITVNGKNYRHEKWDGFRFGKEEEVEYSRKTGAFIGLCFRYGGATQKTGHDFADDTAHDHIEFLNKFISEVSPESAKPTAQSTGERQQKF